METNQNQAPSFAEASDVAKAMSDKSEGKPVPAPTKSADEMLLEIYENTRKTKSYMKWQLYITLVLVVLPLLAALTIVPFVMSSLTSSYGSLLQ